MTSLADVACPGMERAHAMLSSFQLAPGTAASRLDQWNAALSELFSGLVADPDDRARFDARLHWRDGGALTVVAAAAGRCRMHHPAATASGESPSLVLKIQLTGRSLAEHLGHEALLSPGDLIVFDSDKPHRLTLLEDSEMLAFSMSKADMGDELPRAEPLAGVRLSGGEQAVSGCRDYAQELWRHCRTGLQASLTVENARALCGLVGECRPSDTASARRPRRADWQRIEMRLLEYIYEPELSITRISNDLGVSPRRLQQIFAARGTTPARHVLEARLKEARRRLSSPACRHQSVTCIALDVGFGDLTYFGRAFRARYGTTPAAFRRAVDVG